VSVIGLFPECNLDVGCRAAQYKSESMEIVDIKEVEIDEIRADEEEVKAERHSRSEATALVLVKNVKSLLASLHPNRFLAWTKHSYSDSGKSPEIK